MWTFRLRFFWTLNLRDSHVEDNVRKRPFSDKFFRPATLSGYSSLRQSYEKKEYNKSFWQKKVTLQYKLTKIDKKTRLSSVPACRTRCSRVPYPSFPHVGDEQNLLTF